MIDKKMRVVRQYKKPTDINLIDKIHLAKNPDVGGNLLKFAVKVKVNRFDE